VSELRYYLRTVHVGELVSVSIQESCAERLLICTQPTRLKFEEVENMASQM